MSILDACLENGELLVSPGTVSVKLHEWHLRGPESVSGHQEAWGLRDGQHRDQKRDREEGGDSREARPVQPRPGHIADEDAEVTEAGGQHPQAASDLRRQDLGQVDGEGERDDANTESRHHPAHVDHVDRGGDGHGDPGQHEGYGGRHDSRLPAKLFQRQSSWQAPG